jgi:hypothetical protein
VEERGPAVDGDLAAVVDGGDPGDDAVSIEFDGGDANEAVGGGPLEPSAGAAADDVAEHAGASVGGASEHPGQVGR